MRVFTKAVKNYKSGINIIFSPKYLLYTNVVLSMGISGLGDALEQSYELHKEQIEKYDYHRTVHMCFSGACAGVICHNWYRFMDIVIKGRTFKHALQKVFLDQAIASPVLILSFFATVAIFEENPLENFTEEVQDKFWILYRAEWTVWPPAQLINFYLLPTKYRVGFDNSISLLYDIYTSKVKHSKKPPKEEAKQIVEVIVQENIENVLKHIDEENEEEVINVDCTKNY